MSRDRPDSDQERRLSKGSAPLPPNHPPGMETRGPGKEGMKELQGSKREEPHNTNPTLCRQKKPNLVPSLGKPRVPQSLPETEAGSLCEEQSKSPPAAPVHPLLPHIPTAPQEFVLPPALSAAPCPQVLYKSRHSAAWLVRQAPRRAAAPLASWPSSLGNLTWTRPAPAPSFPWKVPHKRLRSLFSAPGEKGLC